MKSKVYTNLLIVLSLFSCKGGEDSTYLDNEAYYKSIYNGFETKLIEHFPKNIKGGFNSFRNLIPENDNYTTDIGRLYLVLENVSEIDSLTTFYKKNSIAFYTSSDINLIPLYFKDSIYHVQNNLIELYDNYKMDSLNISNENYPLPNFKYVNIFEKRANTIIGLSTDFVSYIVDSKNGKFSDNDKLYMSNSGLYFSEKWLHGMSRGVSISESKKTIIYWVIYW